MPDPHRNLIKSRDWSPDNWNWDTWETDNDLDWTVWDGAADEKVWAAEDRSLISNKSKGLPSGREYSRQLAFGRDYGQQISENANQGQYKLWSMWLVCLWGQHCMQVRRGGGANFGIAQGATGQPLKPCSLTCIS